jgi:hypothetical protein
LRNVLMRAVDCEHREPEGMGMHLLDGDPGVGGGRGADPPPLSRTEWKTLVIS